MFGSLLTGGVSYLAQRDLAKRQGKLQEKLLAQQNAHELRKMELMKQQQEAAVSRDGYEGRGHRDGGPDTEVLLRLLQRDGSGPGNRGAVNGPGPFAAANASGFGTIGLVAGGLLVLAVALK